MNKDNHLSDRAKTLKQEIIKYLDETAPTVEKILADTITDEPPDVPNRSPIPISRPKKFI